MAISAYLCDSSICITGIVLYKIWTLSTSMIGGGLTEREMKGLEERKREIEELEERERETEKLEERK